MRANLAHLRFSLETPALGSRTFALALTSHKAWALFAFFAGFETYPCNPFGLSVVTPCHYPVHARLALHFDIRPIDLLVVMQHHYLSNARSAKPLTLAALEAR